MPRSLRRLKGRSGFTILEMIITVAVMAILVSISMPAIFEYMRQRDQQQEEVVLTEIRKAIKAYLSHTGALPSDNLVSEKWFEKLAGYTNLSVSEIENDVYGRPRTYVVYQNTQREMFGNTVNVFYATVHSMGVNGSAENTYKNNSGGSVTIDGLAVNNDAFQGASSSNWWSRKSGANPKVAAENVVNTFSTLRAGGDDHILRFTNYSEVLDSYNLTMQRLDTLTEALVTYARSRYAERVGWCLSNQTHVDCTNGTPEKTIYYPRAVPSSANTEVASGAGRNVIYSDITVVVDNGKGDTARREDLEKLMDLLGLPRENCCSALVMSSDGKPKPFYYFSNPRPRSTSGCAARPQTTATVNDSKLPARVTTEDVTSTCG